MEPDDNIEIYIPKEAEVTPICLKIFPKSFLKHIAVEPRTSQDEPNSPDGVWICPVAVRLKGQSQATEKLEDFSLKLFCKVRSGPAPPTHVSIVCSNHSNQAAYNLLKSLPSSSTPDLHQEVYIVYRKYVSLFIKYPKPKTFPPVPVLKKEQLDDSRSDGHSLEAPLIKDKSDATQQEIEEEVCVPEFGDIHSAGIVQGLEELNMKKKEEDEVEVVEVNDDDDKEEETRQMEEVSFNLQSNFDFNALAEEEKLAQMRAKYQQTLKNLPPL